MSLGLLLMGGNTESPAFFPLPSSSSGFSANEIQYHLLVCFDFCFVAKFISSAQSLGGIFQIFVPNPGFIYPTKN